MFITESRNDDKPLLSAGYLYISLDKSDVISKLSLFFDLL